MRIRNTSKKISLIRKSHNSKNVENNTTTILADRDDLTHVRVNSRLMNNSVPPTQPNEEASIVVDKDTTFITNDFSYDYPPAEEQTIVD